MRRLGRLLILEDFLSAEDGGGDLVTTSFVASIGSVAGESREDSGSVDSRDSVGVVEEESLETSEISGLVD